MSDLVRKRVRDVPDFPKKGILFRDLTPVLADPKAFKECIDVLAARITKLAVNRIVAIESRGFLFGAPVAYHLGVALTIVRKPGKLPWHKDKESYSLEYGTDSLEMHTDGVTRGDRVVVVDDLLATGGTAEAVGRLVTRHGAEVAEYAFVVELTALKGRARLGETKVFSMLQY
jgi:adenine phosphoribosyltransferase